MRLETPSAKQELTARSPVNCYFDPLARDGLARVRPGREVTIRGIVRKVDDERAALCANPNVQVAVEKL